MKISDYILEMELNGVDSATIAEIIELCKDKGFNKDDIDDELVRRGYDRVFIVNDDDYDDWDNDDDFMPIQKFPHKRQLKG